MLVTKEKIITEYGTKDSKEVYTLNHEESRFDTTAPFKIRH